MFTTFPVHKKRPAAGAGILYAGKDAAEKRSFCFWPGMASRQLFRIIILHFGALVHTIPSFFTYYRAFAQTSTGFSGKFWFAAAAESDKKSCRPSRVGSFL